MYHVMWEMDIEAENAVEAARLAWDAMRAPGSIANVFAVTAPTGARYEVDLFLDTRTKHEQRNSRQPYPREPETGGGTFNDWTMGG